MKKTTKTLIISIAAVVLLVGVFLLVYFLLPQQEDPKDIENQDTSSSDSSDYTAEDEVTDYHLITHIPADIEKIEVDNETGKYTLLADTPTTEVTDSDGTTSTQTEATVYTLVGFEDMELLGGNPDMLANDAAAVEAGRIVNDGSKKSDFGFDSPRATVNVTYKGGDKATIIVGDDAPDNQGTYLMVNDDKNVYLVTTDSADGFLLGAMGMISTQIGSAAADESGNVFSKMVFGGSLFGGDVVFEYANDSAYSETYRITSPDNVLANEEVVTYMINNVRNLTAEEVMAVNADESRIKEYGLNDPYVTVEAEYPDIKVSYKATKPDSEDKVYILSGGVIYKIGKESVPWALHDYNECVDASIMDPKLSAVSAITVEANGKEYKFDVKNETTTQDDVETTTTTVTCNGTAIDEDKFNVFYQNLTSAQRAGGIEDSTSGKKQLLKVTVEFTNGTKSSAEYFEAENRKCPVLINDSLSSYAFEEYVTKMIADTPQIAANQSIKSVY